MARIGDTLLVTRAMCHFYSSVGTCADAKVGIEVTICGGHFIVSIKQSSLPHPTVLRDKPVLGPLGREYAFEIIHIHGTRESDLSDIIQALCNLRHALGFAERR